MSWGYTLIGLIVGIAVAANQDDWIVGALIGAAIGYLLARVVELERRVSKLQAAERLPKSSNDRAARWNQPEDFAKPPASKTSPHPAQSASSGAQNQTEPLVTTSPSPWQSVERQLSAGPSPIETLIQSLIKKITTFMSTGNVPVKVGVIISFFGVGFLLKYAIDQNLMSVPLELRLLAVAAAGLALLAIGWRLRQRKRVYALSLQGGGIGILFLTIFASLQIWQMLPATLAFLIMIVLTLLTGFLAVLQNSRNLAILGVVGGFLAPVVTSTGQGQHVILFSYYLLLNAAIVGIAWFRSWRSLNLIGWVFTFLVGSAWGYLHYSSALFASTEPFLISYFLFYTVIAVLFSFRQPAKTLGIVDGTLVFGTPIVAFALQSELVKDMHYGLAWSAGLVALFYALVAVWLWRGHRGPLKLLTESFSALAVVFATIMIPLAFDDRWTAATWAIEGAALVWLGVRQNHQLPKLAGTALIFLAGWMFIDGGWQWDVGLPLLNGNVLGGLLIGLGALFASHRLDTPTEPAFSTIQKLGSVALFLWGAAWWFATGWTEIADRVQLPLLDSKTYQAPIHVLFISLSLAAAAWVGHRRQWKKMRRASWLLLPTLALAAIFYFWDQKHLLLGLGWLAWPLAIAAQLYVLRIMDEHQAKPAALWHLGSLLLLAFLMSMETHWWVTQLVAGSWADAAAVSIPGLLALLVWSFESRLKWPLARHPQAYLSGTLLLVLSQLALLTSLSFASPGSSAPLAYIPLLNPYDMALVLSLFIAARSMLALRAHNVDEDPSSQQLVFLYKLLLALACLVLTTCALVRGVHHFTGVIWDADALFNSIVVQTVLSIYWGLLGFIGMLWGTRSNRRPLWLAGAGFMTLVVIKLFAIDLGNTATVERIISFIGIGALLLVVGYFAPAPPKLRDQSDNNTETDAE